MNFEVVLGLRNKYNDIPEQIINRSIEYAKDEVDLFEILSSFPYTYPVAWSFQKRKWVHLDLLESF